MIHHLENNTNCLLISIEAVNRDDLFCSYRDYLVFMSLVNDAVRSVQSKVYGFCWLKKQCLMLVESENNSIGNFILRLLRRYHFWLLQKGSTKTEFKLGILEMKNYSWVQDCLRYLHQKAVNNNVVDDPMDYHWHSHHVYNGFWSIDWIDTTYILDKFAGSRLIAMNRYRQYMLEAHQLNFDEMIDQNDSSMKYISQAKEVGWDTKHRVVAEINSQYHQSLMDRTQITFMIKSGHQHITVNVANSLLPEAENQGIA